MSSNPGNESPVAGHGSPPDIEIRLRENDAFDSDDLGAVSQGTTEVANLYEEIAQLKAMVKQLSMQSQTGPRQMSDDQETSASLGYKLPKLEAPVFYGEKHNDLDGVIRWTTSAKIYMSDRFQDDEARWLKEVKLLFRDSARLWYESAVRENGSFESWNALTQEVFRKYAGVRTVEALYDKFNSLTMKSADDFDRHLGAFRQLLDQLEMMGSKDSEIHVFKTFINSLTPAFKAKALEYEREQLAKEVETTPQVQSRSRLDRLIAYLSHWISHLSPSSSSTEVVIHHVSGQETQTKNRKKPKKFVKGHMGSHSFLCQDC
ncbi:hypothetical protein PSENEW3n2_00001713 [Picochlorum sp. SENEW3]|nr:hypothetical protein PSENEW3n2_00001713 [Picochlorum sp. SENEW3]WPT14483.1 hypothetical protein PSENEW3_00001713 [Picochlorum sp. SENEW3]